MRALTSAMRLMFKYKFIEENMVQRRVDDMAITRSQTGPIFVLDFPRSQSFINSTAYSLKAEWNKLPLFLRSIDDYEHFRRAVGRYFRDEYGLSQNNSLVTQGPS